MHALGARDDARALRGERAEVRERMQVVAGVEFLPVARPRSGDLSASRSWLSPRSQTFSSRCSRSHELITREKVSYSFSLTAQYAATKRSPNNSTSVLLALQHRQRIGERARQRERQVVGRARDRRGRLQPLDHAEVAAGERGRDARGTDSRRRRRGGSRRAAPAARTSARAGPTVRLSKPHCTLIGAEL